jgi:hypothetical protein
MNSKRIVLFVLYLSTTTTAPTIAAFVLGRNPIAIPPTRLLLHTQEKSYFNDETMESLILKLSKLEDGARREKLAFIFQQQLMTGADDAVAAWMNCFDKMLISIGDRVRNDASMKAMEQQNIATEVVGGVVPRVKSAEEQQLVRTCYLWARQGFWILSPRPFEL